MILMTVRETVCGTFLWFFLLTILYFILFIVTPSPFIRELDLLSGVTLLACSSGMFGLWITFIINEYV